MKAVEYEEAGLYRLNAVIPSYLGDKLALLAKPDKLNMSKKSMVTQALMDYVEKSETRLGSFNKGKE